MTITTIRALTHPALIAGVFAGVVAGTACRGTADDQPGPAGGSVTRWTDSTELFMEFPGLIVGDSAKFAVHLTDLTDFAPLRSGRVTLRFTPRDGGAPLVVTQDAPRLPGIFGPAATFTKAGVYDLTLLVESPQARDSISIPDFRVYATVAEAPKDSAVAETGIRFLKEQQWKTLDFRTTFARAGAAARSVEVAAQVMPAGGRIAEVTSPIAGLLDAASVLRAPAPGQRVTEGQVLAVLTPALGESGSAYAEARARLAETEDEFNRARRLLAVEAIPARRLHEAEIRLRAAREALAGLGGEDGQIAVRSPIAGVVVRRSLASGTRVAAGQALFMVIDPSRVWLTANVPAAMAAQVTMGSTASFTVEGSGRTFQAASVVSIGAALDSLTRTLPVIFEVANRDGALKIGALARATIRIGGRIEGIAVPSAAVLDNDGRPVVYVQTGGESFERREVVIATRDGGTTIVASGLTRGDRVVTGAAYQIRLASLSTSLPAQGHVH